MDAPWKYDETGLATSLSTKTKIQEQEEYLHMVKHYERSEGNPSLLSDVLGDQAGQDLATAMRYFTVVGKQAFYSKVFDERRERWGSKPDDC